MAGVKGMKGGGGYRPGAGRKPKPKVVHQVAETILVPEPAEVPEPIDGKPNMLDLLINIALGRVDANAQQVRAAIAAVQYTHTKTHDGGKKEAVAERAKKASAGRFAPKAPPKLVVNNG